MKALIHISHLLFQAISHCRQFLGISSFLLLFGAMYAQTPTPFTTTKYENVGGNTYAVPSGVTQIKVEVWGGGGSGSKVTSNGLAGGGGGGGAYSRSVLSNLSSSYNLFVGSGGVSNGSTASARSGGPSSFGGALVSANGGNGAPGNSATGGAGGTTSGVGTSKFSGGNGANGSYTWPNRYSGGGGGGAGAYANGSNGNQIYGGSGGGNYGGGNGANGRNDKGVGYNGNAIGGGGSGGYASDGNDQNGGSGAAGAVWVTPVNVEVTATLGATLDYYANIGDAFTAINNGYHRGDIEVKILRSITEPFATSLNASGSGSAQYARVIIYPTAANVVVSASFDYSALISLNGADNVTIDGRINASGSTVDLTLENTSTASGATTIDFINSAQNNTIQYCTIKGSGGGTYNGSVNISTGTNTGNRIQYNQFTKGSARRIHMLFSAGTNNGNGTVSNNVFLNSWALSGTTSAITLESNSSNWVISDNSFYDTELMSLTSAVEFRGISVNNTSSSGIQIARNYFGGDAPQALGNIMNIGNFSTNSVRYNPIYINAGVSAQSVIEDNVIRNIYLQSSNTEPFVGIQVIDGYVLVDQNLIGSSNGVHTIQVVTQAAQAKSYGMKLTTYNTLLANENVVSGIQVGAVNNDYGHSFYGIYAGNFYGTQNITNNTIGHASVSGSVTTSGLSTTNVQSLFGIYSEMPGILNITGNKVQHLVNASQNPSSSTIGTIMGIVSIAGSAVVSNNLIKNLSNASGNTSLTTPSVVGIMTTGTGGSNTVTNNEIGVLKNLTSSNNAVIVVALSYGSTTYGTNVVDKNFIYDLSSSSNQCAVGGILVNNGTGTFSNNVIYLNNDLSNQVYGVYNSGGSGNTFNFYHNTVYLSGSTSATAGTYGLYLAQANNVRDIRNNILFNARSTGSSGYAIYYAVTGTANLTANFNNYRVTGSGGNIAFYGSDLNLANLKTTIGQDANSSDLDPQLHLAGGSLAENYKTHILQTGDVVGINTDFGGNARVARNIGAWEFSPIEIWSNGQFRNAFFTLKGAFDAINAGAWNGHLTVKVLGNSIETATAELNASGVGSANYQSVLIYPEASGLSISGNFNNPLVHLKGADNVRVNGSVFLNNLEADLTFINNNTGANASVLLFSESAQNNSLRFAKLKGAPQSASTGVVHFSTSVSGTGNVSDSILFCQISGTETSRPWNAIYAVGSPSAKVSGLVLNNNQIFNFLNPSNASHGIFLGANSEGVTISNNSFYETTSFSSTADVSYAVIRIENSTGGGYQLLQNYIGGNAPMGVGTWSKSGGNNVFEAIRLNVGSAVRTSLQGNRIKGFNYTNSGNASWYGVNIVGGGIDFGTQNGNNIGETEAYGSIYITNGTTGGVFYGINLAGNAFVDVANSVIGSVSIGFSSTSSALSASIYGIYKSGASGNTRIRSNMIGSPTTSNSLHARSQSTGNIQTLMGIYSAGTDTMLVESNEIANLTNSTTGTQVSRTRGIMTEFGSNFIENNDIHHLSTLNAQANNYDNATLIGIHQISQNNGTQQKVTGNNVHDLINLSISTIEMYGIHYKGPSVGNHEVSRNFVHTFHIISTDMAYLHGISMHTGAYTLANNIVYLGNNITTGCYIWGIWNYSNSEVNIYHNTVYLTGTATTGASNTYAFRDISTAPSDRDIRNNVFWNGRTNNPQISHFALYFNSTSNTVLDYNDYQFSQYFARIGDTQYQNLSSWVAATPFDDHSVIVDPQLTNLGGTSPSDYQAGVVLNGVQIAGQTLDFGFVERSLTSPTMGAWEYISDPVEIWNGAVFRANYPNLKAAFDAINLGTWTGNLIIKIKANVIENASAVLYQSGYTGSGGLSNYSKLVIYPTRADIQVRGNLNAPLVILNGADQVVFDGRVNGTQDAYQLSLINEFNSINASTLRLINSASNDTIRFTQIKGLSIGSSNGIVHIGTSVSGQGNDNNALILNKITSVQTVNSLRVGNAIFVQGSAGYENDNVFIQSNEIYNVFNPNASSNAILIADYVRSSSLVGNSFYETAPLTPTGAYVYRSISINSVSNGGFTISGNYIGGSAVSALGKPLQLSASNAAHTFSYNPIFLHVGTAQSTSVQANTITNIKLSGPNTQQFSAVRIDAGNVLMGTTAPNIIGSSSLFNAIESISTVANASTYGVFVNGVSDVVIANNQIGGMYTNSSATTNAHSLYGVYKSASGGLLRVESNLIGSQTQARNFRAGSISSSNAQVVYGIYTLGTGHTTIQDNIVANLMDSTTRNNAANSIGGIYFGGSTAAVNTIQRNFIYKLDHACITSNASNLMAGIHLAQGSVNVVNNIVWIGEGLSTSNRFYIYGIYELGVVGSSNKLLHNTVHLSGSAITTSRSSAAYYKANNVGSSEIRNNIFYNLRTGGGVDHHAVSLPGISNIVIDANDYACASTLLNFLTWSRSGLAAWKSVTGQDANSLNVNPYAIPGSENPVSFRPSLDLYGVSVGIGTDFGNYSRNATQPTMGAWERVNKWKGNISIDFNNAANWTFNMVPAAYDNVIFDESPLRPCYLDVDRFINDVVNAQAPYRLVLNGKKLSLRGALNLTNGAQLDASAVGSVMAFVGAQQQSIPSNAFYQDKVYQVEISNAANVVLNGRLILLDQITATAGRLNAQTTGSTFVFGGSTPQTIQSGRFLNESIHNLEIRNPAGVTLSGNFTTLNHLSIAAGSVFTLGEFSRLTAQGNVSNLAGVSGFVLRSTAYNTASFMHQVPGVPATVQRFIGGDSLAWHFLAPPVVNQPIHGSTWTPTGNYGDGTGYDLYIWDETASCWVYNLNTTTDATWSAAHPQLNFVPGRGYLYAVQALNPVKSFVGLLNGGPVSRPITNSISAIDSLAGFNLMGNPYASSIDWRINQGYSRNMLQPDGGGYWIWIWSALNNNYGVYNSASTQEMGTNNVSAYISPMQGFFVEAASSGTFEFKPQAQTHQATDMWLRSSETPALRQQIHVKVKGPGGGDEIQLSMGDQRIQGGARKLFSPIAEAPSLYMNWRGGRYSTKRMVHADSARFETIQFAAGKDGEYTLSTDLEIEGMETVYLEDLQTGHVQDLSVESSYTFNARVSDNPNRFVLHFNAIRDVDFKVNPKIWTQNNQAQVYLENMIGEFDVVLYHANGYVLYNQRVSGGEQLSIPLPAAGLYLIQVSGNSQSKSYKVMQ